MGDYYGELAAKLARAEQWVVWCRLPDGEVSLEAKRMDAEKLEAFLLNLAADLHQRRTDVRAGAIIIEEGEVGALVMALGSSAIYAPTTPSGTVSFGGSGITAATEPVVKRIRALIEERDLR